MTLVFPISNVLVEGCDLAGKSSIYQQIHRETRYRWNIIDRSTLSRLAYSELYGRDRRHDEHLFDKELSNLNNRFVILHPSWETIVERYNHRGDDIQDEESLRRLHAIFGRWADLLEDRPNVECLREPEADLAVTRMVKRFLASENKTVIEIAGMVESFVDKTPEKEAFPLSFTFYDDGNFSGVDDTTVSTVPGEVEYYESIRGSLSDKIHFELSENNQDLRSRRFIHTNDSCLSLFHAMFRSGTLDCHVVIRSSNVEELLSNDLRFICQLGKDTYNRLGLTPVVNRVRYRVQINSAHILA